jgi:DNA-binding MarR family transcriptional regulator
MANQIPKRVSPDFQQRYPQASAIATECAMNLVFSVDLVLKRIASLIQHLNITPASGLVLSILADSVEPVPPHKIAEQLIISRATVTGLIDSLERRGFVTRLRHPTDRRMLLVELTDDGRRVTNEFRPIVHNAEKAWFDNFSDAEQRQLLKFLVRLQTTLTDIATT